MPSSKIIYRHNKNTFRIWHPEQRHYYFFFAGDNGKPFYLDPASGEILKDFYLRPGFYTKEVYTGANDSADVKIYEGDIVEFTIKARKAHPRYDSVGLAIYAKQRGGFSLEDVNNAEILLPFSGVGKKFIVGKIVKSGQTSL